MNHHSSVRISLLSVLATLPFFGIGVGARAAESIADAPDFEMELALVGAVFDQQPNNDGPSLIIDLARTGERWERVIGVARSLNVAIHAGRVEKATVTDTKIELQLEMKVEGDAWIAGGRGSYNVSLTRTADGTLAGTHTGTYKGVAVKGRVAGRVKPSQKPAEGYIPVQAGEHPRVLFRKQDLPALRERAKTDFGKLCIERMGGESEDGDATGMGLRWQLTGDKSWAEKAQASVERHMANQGGGALAVGRSWGPRQEQVALAYDLCHDAWTPEFRKKVEAYLRWITFNVFSDQTKLSRTINWNVTSNYAGPIYAGSAFAGLALWGEKAPEPVKPQPPAAVAEIPSAKDFKPQADVPIVPLELGKSPTKWLATNALPLAVAADPMQTIGGLEKERPAPGTKFTFDEHELTYQPLAAEFIQQDKGGIAMDSLKKDKGVTCAFYTVLDNPEPRRVKVRSPFSKAGRTQMVLNGMRVAHDQVVQLEKGLYPMHCVVRLSTKWSSFEPALEAATDADVEKSKTLLVEQNAEYEAALKDWEYEYAEWKRMGGVDQSAIRLFQQGKRMMTLFGREGCGRGGYQAESGSYFMHAMSGPNRYHSAYLNMFGRPLSTMDDLSHYLPRILCATVYEPGAKAKVQGINADLSQDPANFSALFPLVPTPWQPGVLWAWNLQVGGNPDKPDLAKIAAGDPVQAFLHYPFQLKPLPPEKAGFPLTWQAPDYGYYSFRNAWAGGDDIVFQAFGKCSGSGGWGGPDGGTFRLMGFGQVWAYGNQGREVHRFLESVVLFPDGPDFALSQGGQLLHSDARPDGSGTVSFDLSRLTLAKSDKANWPKREQYGGIWHEGTAKPAAKYVRAFGVDYSGKSGAPALFAIVDSIEGAKSKLWTWQLDDPSTAKATPDGFTITKGGASLVGRFIAPAGVKTEVATKDFTAPKGAGSGSGTLLPYSVKWASATGADPNEGRFFFVGTLQKGEAPKITVTGKGLEAVVKVGGRTVRFDGTKVVFGE